MSTKAKTDDRAESQARAQAESICEMLATLERAETDNEREEAEQTIHDDPLSIQVREGWHNPGEPGETVEFEILLCTGGPAVRIVGDLGQHNEPENPRLQYQDWGTPWTDYYKLTGEQEQALLEYCQQFYFSN